MKIVELIRRPRIEGGADWGVERDVLVRLVDNKGTPIKEVWWTKGHTYWSGLCSRSYARSRLSFVEAKREPYSVGSANSTSQDIFEGRFSKKNVLANAGKINEFFGCEIAHLIKRGQTIVLDG